MVRVRRVPPPGRGPDTDLVVSQALVPLLYWRGVPVLREHRLELTVLERFVLEMALALGGVEPEDFAEVTSLPSSVLAGAAWRLISSGTLLPRGGSYGVDPEKAADALRQEAVRRLTHSKANFALLPRTGDLIAVNEQNGGWLRELELKLSPDRPAPLPRSLWTATRAAFLSERIRTGTVAGLETDIVDVPQPSGPDAPLALPVQRADQSNLPVCPAYLCRAEIRTTHTGAQAISAIAYGRPRGKSDNPAEVVEIEIDLTGARGLATEWQELANALEDPQTLLAAWHELTMARSATGETPLSEWPPLDGARHQTLGTWELLVNGEATQLLCAQGHPLGQPMGLAVEGEEAVIHLTCAFFPTDDKARALFARDDLVKRLLTTRQVPEYFPVACREAANNHLGASEIFSEESIQERIWQLGHYHLVYQIREHKDFCYD